MAFWQYLCPLTDLLLCLVRMDYTQVHLGHLVDRRVSNEKNCSLLAAST